MIKKLFDIVSAKSKQSINTNLKELEKETLGNLKNSKSNNTLRAYRADFNHFEQFCLSNDLKYMPANIKTLSLYLTKLSKSSKFSTLKRRLASIKVIHQQNGHYLDIKHPLVTENLLGIKRVMGTYQKAKKPILISDLKAIIKVINQESDELKKTRNKALILIGFAGGFRRSELVSLNIDDLDFVNEGVKIFVKKSKTDQSGEGMTKAIPYFENDEFCPVISLKKWLQNSGIKNGKIFNISDRSVALTIKKYAAMTGLDETKYAGHSLRSGFATSTAELGAEERSIMAMTGHKSVQMVRRYIQDANLFKNNALNKIKI